METLELEIQDLARGGAGVARDATGRVVFVPFTAPGDRVRVKILSEEKRYAQGQLLEVLTPSQIRTQPKCGAFQKCGGCQWQHLPYPMQWQTKVSGVKHALKRVGVESPDMTEFPSQNPYGYRNRIQLRGDKGRLGFFAPRSHDLIPIEGCPIARPEINQAWEETRSETSKFPLPYKVEVEVTAEGQIQRTWNSPHAGAGFRQINDEQNRNMREWVKANITPGRILIDLYGGSGNLSLPLAPLMQETHCVDTSAPRITGPHEGVTFHRTAVLPWVLRLRHARKPAPTTVIVDPPREGLGKDLPEIAAAMEKLGADEWIAVGCDPDNWARDVSRLQKRGWQLIRAATLDFFPQTPHVESIALLRRT